MASRRGLSHESFHSPVGETNYTLDRRGGSALQSSTLSYTPAGSRTTTPPIPRVVFVGARGVGKTALIHYCIEEKPINPTRTFTSCIADEYITEYALLIDTSGDEENWGSTHREIMSADVVVLVFDVVYRKSLDDISKLADFFGKIITVPVVICANKTEMHIFSYEAGELGDIQRKFNNCSLLLTSAITGAGCSFLLEFIKTGSHRSPPITHDVESDSSDDSPRISFSTDTSPRISQSAREIAARTWRSIDANMRRPEQSDAHQPAGSGASLPREVSPVRYNDDGPLSHSGMTFTMSSTGSLPLSASSSVAALTTSPRSPRQSNSGCTGLSPRKLMDKCSMQ